MAKSILDTDVSLFNHYYDPKPAKTVNLLQWLQDDNNQEKVERIRTLEKDARDKIKATLPCITVSGVFSTRARAGLTKHSGLICIDIDLKDNRDIENYGELKRILSTARFVAYCGLSVSGTGYFVIIPIKYPEKHEMQFEALRRMFERLGVSIDISCKDVSRLRGYSWDDEAYINHNAITFDKVYEEPEPVKQEYKFTKYRTENRTDSRTRVEDCINVISEKGIDLTDGYKKWLTVGFAIASEFGEDGRKYFHDVSRCYAKYNYDEADKKYSNLLSTNKGVIRIGTFFHLCKAQGVTFKSKYNKKPFKFQQNCEG